MTEAAAVMGRTYNGVASKASELKIEFHGPDGAPFLNNNAAAWRLRQTANAKTSRVRSRRRTGTMARRKE